MDTIIKMALPASYDIQIYRGDDYTKTLRFVAQDISTLTVLAQCRSALTVNSPLLFSFDSDSVLDGLDTVITLSVPAVVTADLNAGIYFYDVQVGNFTRLSGSLEIIADVSRAV